MRRGGFTRSPDRPGPVTLPEDSWESGSTELYPPTTRRGFPVRYLWVALILTATAIVTMGLPMILAGDRRTAADPTADRGPDRPGPPRASQSQGGGVAVLHTAPAAARTVSPGSAPPSGDGSSSAGAPSAAASPSASASPMPLVVEAESPAVRLRRALVESVAGTSGGSAVRFTDSDGEIRIDSLAIPQDRRYRVTVRYAPGGAWSANLRGRGGPVRVSFVAGTGCCATVAAEVSLAPAGTLRIGLSNGTGTYPAVDSIIIEDLPPDR